MFESLFKFPFKTFADGALSFLSRIPVEVWILVFVGLAAMTWWLYRRVSGRLRKPARRTLTGLRAATYAGLVFLLAIPALSVPDPKSHGVFTAVLMDTSRSMAIDDLKGGSTRLQGARRVLLGQDELGESGLLKDVHEKTNVLLYGFDQHARRLTGAKGVQAKGGYTNIFQSMRDVDAELRAVPLASVVMLTDGCRNVGGRAQEAARLLAARGVPLFVVGLGNAKPPQDLEIVRVFAPRRVRRNSEVEIHITLRHTGFTKPFPIHIRRGETRLVTETVTPTEGADLKRIRLPLTPDHDGSATYTVEIPTDPSERIVENNAHEFVLQIQDDRLPVLYIEGSPRTEYRYIRRALFRDRDFRLVGMLRLAKGRFYVQGANKEEAYTEKTFPDTRERLFAFQAIILGDIEASYFTAKQLELLEAFARERGGGLLMLGGVNSFGLGRYANTAVGKALPLEISPRDPAYSDAEYKPQVIAKHLGHPVMRLLPDADSNQRYWEKAPPLIGITPTRGVKPGAMLLLEQPGTRKPVLAVQNYGQGRVAAFTSGGSWCWQMSKPLADEFHEKFWRQLVRWLVMGAREQLSVHTDSDVYAPREAAYVRAMVHGKDLKPVNDAKVIAKITDPLGNVEELPMDWILSQEGVYQCRVIPVEEGEYTVSVRVEGWKNDPVETGFHVSEPHVEYINAGLKEEVLKEMAKHTNGHYFTEETATDLAQAVGEAAEAATTANTRPRNERLHDMPLIYVLLLGILCVEWFIRRRSGLS